MREQVKLLDFGLSVYRHLVDADGADCAGTFAYMAPEILRGEPPSEQCDLYALGVIAFELCTAGERAPQSRHFGVHQGTLRPAPPRRTDAIDARLRPIVGHA